MTKNITVGISDELSERMEGLRDVNWSAVTRDCIEQYIRQRTSSSLESAIAKLKAMRGDEFKKGYEFVIEKSEKLGLTAIAEIAYPDRDKHEDLLLECLDSKLVDAILRYDVDEDDNISNIRYKVSSNFIQGMQEAAKELLEKSE